MKQSTLTPENTRIAFIGTGVMGRSMAGHLLKAGYSINVFNRTRSKADDLVTAQFGTPMAYIDGVMDSRWGEYPDFLPERVQYLGAQINQALDNAEKVLDIKIAPDAWEKAQKGGQTFAGNLLRLVDLLKADPVPVILAAKFMIFLTLFDMHRCQPNDRVLGGDLHQLRCFFSINTAFVPPKPKELVMANSTSVLRHVFGT